MKKYIVILLVLATALMIGCSKNGETDKTAEPTTKTSATATATGESTPTPEPTEEPTPAPTATPLPSPKGTNVALNKPYEVSSFTFHARGWKAECVNDGIIESIDGVHFGWTSQIGQYSADMDPEELREWVIIDLQQEYNIAQVWVWPRQDGGAYFANDYQLDVSNDKENWTTVSEVKDDPLSEDFDITPRVFELTDVKARYIRFMGTELRNDNTTYNDGYLMQLAEIEVFSED